MRTTSAVGPVFCSAGPAGSALYMEYHLCQVYAKFFSRKRLFLRGRTRGRDVGMQKRSNANAIQ